jgi:hypothetical protein
MSPVLVGLPYNEEIRWAETLSRDPRIKYAEPDYYFYLLYARP